MAEPSVSVSRSEPIGALRTERDRFRALAFSSADVLLELDDNREIVFAAGITEVLLGMEQRDLVGRPFINLVNVRDRPMVHEALALAGSGTRVNGLILHLEGVLGTTPPLVLLGYRRSQTKGHYFLGLRLGAHDSGGFATPGTEGLLDSGLADARTFARLAGEKLAELTYSGVEHDLTLIRLEGIGALRERLDRDGRGRLDRAIGGALRAGAMGASLASELDHSNYGLIHAHDLDIEALGERLREITHRTDPEARGTNVRYSTLGLDREAIRSGECAKALGYIFTEFVQGNAEEFPIRSLSQGLASLVDSTVLRIAEFRTLMNNAAFSIAFQPIVDLESFRPHHFEALARFNLPSGSKTPYETITFAEQAGLITDFDLAMCAKVIEWLEEAGTRGEHYKVAINISGSSIGSPIFVKALHRLLERYPGSRGHILFEVTESAKIQDLGGVNAALQSLRQSGYRVCLDDFGAGAAAFQYLRDLEVDMVKIDGAYVKGAVRTEKGVAFLKAIAGLCNDLGIATVAEMVEDPASVPFLQECGIDFGQGYLFGRPSPDITSFKAPLFVRSGPKASRTG